MYPDPTTKPYEFTSKIVELAATHGAEVVFPMTDATTMLLVEHRERFTNSILACSSAQSYEALTDKSKLLALAKQLHVPVPETHLAFGIVEILEASRTIGFPLVLKPARSRYLKNAKIFLTQVSIVHRPEDLNHLLPTLSWVNDISCLVQKFIPGHGAGVFVLYDEQKTVAHFAHTRIREKPPSGGVSVLCESAAPDSLLLEMSKRLLGAVAWRGPAMVEFRISRTGMPYLMEVNGRFWGSLQLSIDSGVDFPMLFLQMLKNTTTVEIPSYRLNQRLRWLLGDLDNLLLQLRENDLSPALKVKAARAFVATFFDRSCNQEIFRWLDPLPAFFELKTWIQALV